MTYSRPFRVLAADDQPRNYKTEPATIRAAQRLANTTGQAAGAERYENGDWWTFRVCYPQDTPRVSVDAVANMTGVRPPTIRSYVARQQMPEPSGCPTCGSSPTWPRETIERWRPNE